MMKPNMLCGVIAASLWLAQAMPALAGGQAATAQTDQTPPPKPAAGENPSAAVKNMKTVQVTGSLIPRAQIEGPSPITTITAKDIEQQGFGDVYQALRALPQANGAIQDGQFTGGFTPGAREISLFGLSPDFTLTLLNGRPLASYPLAFNGSTNITDLANIPVGLIDHIDILTGGQSSIYGSSAIAGVVNIVLKDHIEGTHLDLRVGDYSDGGGLNKRLQLSSGHSFGNFEISGGVQLSKQDPIWAYQRSYIDSNADDPTGKNSAPSRSFLRMATGDNAHYIDPGAATCAPLSYLYKGSTAYSYRPGGNLGYYCGSPKNVGYASISNRETQADATLFLRYHLNDHTELYADTLFSYSNPTYNGGSPSWNQTFYNQNSGQYEQWQRIFAPEEVGLDAQDQHVFTRSYNLATGIRGSLGEDWNYDAYYSRSRTDLTRKSTDFLANDGIDQYYLGPKLGVDANGIPIYAPNVNRLYQPITPGLYDQFTATNTAVSMSQVQNETITVNNPSLFSLPAGDVGLAVIAQTGQETFENRSASPLADQGYFRGQGGSTVASGARYQTSFGTEFRVPLLKELTASVSARFDKYRYGGEGHGKPTYKLGLEYRPLDNLLLRASYATAFRAPDLFYLFSSRSSSYSTVTDYARCRPLGYTTQTYSSCPYTDQQIYAVSSGNTGLKDITAKTLTYGFVWSTDDNRLSWSVDYSAFRISNEVVTLSTDEILTQEANCRLGVSENGQVPYDINSPTCRQVLDEVQRYPASNPVQGGAIQQVSTYPINVASEYMSGIQSDLKYRLDAGWAGTFLFEGAYFDEFKHTYKEKAGDTTLNYLCCGNSDELKSRFTGTVTWHLDKWTSTFYAIRNGSTWNSLGTAKNIGPWITYNASIDYKIRPRTTLSLIVNNLTNARPPKDSTNGSWPYYDQGQYNALGRVLYLEVGFDFGG